jgi:DNA-binding IclR family transcriptional regulator
MCCIDAVDAVVVSKFIKRVSAEDERLALHSSPSGRRIAAAFPYLQQYTEVAGRRLTPETETGWLKYEVVNKCHHTY